MSRTVLLTVMLAIWTAGCDSGPKTPTVSPAAVKKYTLATTLEGVVSNNKGVIKTGIVEANDERGHLISRVPVNEGHYLLEIPANTVLPILLTFSSESNAEKLVTAVIHDSITQYDINPLTTAIAATAKARGGYTHANMTRAAAETVHTPDANKTTTGWRGDPTTQYGGWH